MRSVQHDLEELRRQLGKGSIQTGYRALLAYISGLRTQFANTYGDRAVSGLYQGSLDITFFALFPPSLKRRDLKVAIVFNYDVFGFEAWLAARNRSVQRRYWELVKGSDWGEYRVMTPGPGIDSILECDLATDVDFSDPDGLTARIEQETAAFIDTIEGFLSGHQFR
jgi:hypothetical protein